MKISVPSQVYEVLGWIGVVLVLGGYVLLATGVISGDAWAYHASVLFGSAFVAIMSYRKRAWQPFALNATFVLFALIALFRIFFIK